jgi:type VI secretion system protein ImpL
MSIFLKFLLGTLQGKVFLPIVFTILVMGFLLHNFLDINLIWACIICSLVVIIVWVIFIVWKLKQKDIETHVSEGAIDLKSISKRLIEAQRHHKINNDQWYLMIGSTNSGKTTLIRNLGLKFSHIDSSQRKPIEQGIESTRDCDFFQTEETYESAEGGRKKAFVIDVTGTYINERGIDGDAQTTQRHWLAFLHTLKRHSKKIPIKGLILAVDLESIVQEEEAIEKQANVINERIKDVVSVFGIVLPIYLVFTKCDTVFGFTSFFDALKANRQDEVFGYTFREDQQKEITN